MLPHTGLLMRASKGGGAQRQRDRVGGYAEFNRATASLARRVCISS